MIAQVYVKTDCVTTTYHIKTLYECAGLFIFTGALMHSQPDGIAVSG